MAVDKEAFRQLMGSFAAGVTVVSTIDDSGNKWGLTATAFTSLSLDPPLCLVCIDKRAGSLGAIAASRRFAVSMLAADQTPLSNHFASRVDDKFATVAHDDGPVTGCPLIAGALAAMECEVADIFPGGDHDIVVGKLVWTRVDPAARALAYWRGQYCDIVPKD